MFHHDEPQLFFVLEKNTIDETLISKISCNIFLSSLLLDQGFSQNMDNHINFTPLKREIKNNRKSFQKIIVF